MHSLANKIRAFLQTSFGRYLLIGGSVYLFELVVIFAALQAGTSAVFAVGLSFWLGLIASFLLTKLVTFSDKRTSRRVVIPQIATFSLLVLFNFGFTLAITQLLSGIVPPTITRTLALGTTTIWNFYLYRTRIFKPID